MSGLSISVDRPTTHGRWTAGTRPRGYRIQRLLAGDPEVARRFVLLLAEQEGDQAPSRLLEFMGSLDHSISIEDATVLVMCRAEAS